MPSFSIIFQDAIESVTAFPKIYAIKIPPNSSIDMEYTLKFEKRGVYRFPHTTIISRFPFGFFEKSTEYPCKSEIIVFPQVKKIDRALSLSSEFELNKSRKEKISEGSDIFHGIREFRPGDNPKWIHYRSTAKFQKLMLKEFEMEEINKALIILDTFIPPKGDGRYSFLLEEGIILAASLANYFKEQRCDVNFATYTPELTIIKAEKGKNNLYDIFLNLALLQPNPQHRIESIFPRIESSLFKKSLNITILLDSDEETRKKFQSLARDYALSKIIAISEGKYEKFFSREKKYYNPYQ